MALVVACVMMLSLSMTAFAAPADTTLKVNVVDGHTYKYFQLFTGDLADGKLSNVLWGADAAASITYKEKASAEATEFTVENTVTPVAGQPVPQAVLDYLASLTGKTETDAAQATADIISTWVKGDGTAVAGTDVTVKTGYYVIKDSYTDATKDQTTTLSTTVVEVVGPTTVAPKAGITEHVKKVLDINDTSDTQINLTGLKNIAEGWQDSADYDIGDKVPFQLTTTIASDFTKYNKYYLQVSDTLGAGLTLNQDSIEVYVNGVKATAGEANAEDGTYNVAVSGQTFTITFAKLNANTNAAAGKNVVVYYNATLQGDNVVFGNDGNPNTSYVTYSNNPNGDQSGTTETPEDKVVVFTYRPEITKYKDEAKSGNELAGAGFTLYKEVKDAVTGSKTGAAIKAELATQNASINAAALEDGKNYIVKTMTMLDGKTNVFEFKGIDDGTYVLVETTIPAGYNAFVAEKIVVTATHDTESADPKLTALTADKVVTTTNITDGSLKGNVINNSGSTLPSTGGIGTTIFYVIGAILVLGAGIVLITRRRMNAD